MPITGVLPAVDWIGRAHFDLLLDCARVENVNYTANTTYIVPALHMTEIWFAGGDVPAGKSVYFEAVLYTTTAGVTAYVRLYNVTDGAVVSGSEVSTSSTAGMMRTSGALSLPSGSKIYRVEVKGTDPSYFVGYSRASILVK